MNPDLYNLKIISFAIGPHSSILGVHEQDDYLTIASFVDNRWIYFVDRQKQLH